MPITKYGKTFPDGCNDFLIEAWCFRTRRQSDVGGLGEYGHFRNIALILWPKLVWNDWLEKGIRALCENNTNAWTGCASAGKTFTSALFAMVFYICDPDNTSVILTSTTRIMVKKRIWPVIQMLFRTCVVPFHGNLVDSKTTLQARKGDEKHGIFALAIADGNTSKAAADIQGIHSKRMFVNIDEGTDTPEAIYEVIPNLQKACSDFVLLIVGNANSHLDPHGKCCEPKSGWSSISIEDEEWETKGVPKWGISEGICLHFDGLKSPNIKLGKDKFPYLYTNVDLARDTKHPESKESIQFWKYARGFWAPDGICKTVFSCALVEKYDGYGKHDWVSSKRKIAGLDPAFGGGDRCILRFAEFGDIGPEKMGIQLLESIEIKPQAAGNKEPIHYQIAYRVKLECVKRGVDPKCFGMDATGEGGGLADIITKDWSDEINRVEFGGAVSDLPVSVVDQRKSCDVYDRKVTELWFSTREFLQSGQLKGLTVEDVIEFCGREYSDEKKKIKLDTKPECRKKIGRSPDDADAVTIVVEVAKKLGAMVGIAPVQKQNWLAKAREFSEVFVHESDEENYETTSIYHAEID